MSPIPQSTILVVDDNESARYAKVRLLTATGFRVVDASTAGEQIDPGPPVVCAQRRGRSLDGGQQLGAGGCRARGLMIGHDLIVYQRPVALGAVANIAADAHTGSRLRTCVTIQHLRRRR